MERGEEGGRAGSKTTPTSPCFFSFKDRCREGHYHLCPAQAPALNTPKGEAGAQSESTYKREALVIPRDALGISRELHLPPAVKSTVIQFRTQC